MKLRRECEHGQFDPHRFLQPGGHPESSIAYADCAGGEFLAEDTLVIEKRCEHGFDHPHAWDATHLDTAVCPGKVYPPELVERLTEAIHFDMTRQQMAVAVLDALTVREGEG